MRIEEHAQMPLYFASDFQSWNSTCFTVIPVNLLATAQILEEPSVASTENPFSRNYFVSLPEPHPKSSIRDAGASLEVNLFQASVICTD